MSSAPSAPVGGAPGRNELGSITIADGVVAKIAARAVTDIPDAGAAATKLLGLDLASAGVPGVRSTDLAALPKAEAAVDGSTVTLALTISVRWPKSVGEVTGAVRAHVRARVADLTGLDVIEVRIKVDELATTLAPPPRVR